MTHSQNMLKRELRKIEAGKQIGIQRDGSGGRMKDQNTTFGLKRKMLQ